MRKIEEEKTERLSVDQILAMQVRKILWEAGISGIQAEEDGSLTATYTNKLWPSSTEVKNLRIEVDDGNNKILIKGEFGETRDNIGSII